MTNSLIKNFLNINAHSFFFFVLVLFTFNISLFQSKILFLFEHTRHGARGMDKIYDNDYDILGEKWNGEAELSYVGMRQHYLLGIHNKYKYSELLNFNDYNPNEIVIYSTNSNRTIMSAQAQLSGMFDNNENILTNKQKEMATLPFKITDDNILNKIKELDDKALPFEVKLEFPIHLIEKKDKILKFDCPKMDQLRKSNKKKDIIKQHLLDYNATFGKQLLQYFNKNETDFYADINNVGDIAQAFIMNIVDGRDLLRYQQPGINLDLIYNKSIINSGLYNTEVLAHDPKNEIALSSSSILLRKVLTYMDKIVEKDKNNSNIQTPKLFFLSGHESTVVIMEDIFRVLFNTTMEFPYFAYNLFIELHKDEETKQYYVNIVYNDRVEKSIDYSEFKNIVETKSWTYEQTAEYCEFENKALPLWKYLTFGLLGGSAIMICLFIYLKLRKNKKEELIVTNAPLVV